MRILTEKINLDLNQNGIQATIDLREGDIESRLIIATLRGYGDAFKPDDNVIAVIRAKKPDGTIIYNNCLVEDGKIKFLVTSQYAAVVGNYNACIELIKDGVVLYSPKFSFHVSENELSDSEVESSSEYTELTTALEQALTALELAQNLHLLKFVENLEDEGDEKYLYVLTSDYHYIPYVWDAENERYMQLESNLEELTEFSYLLSIQKERVDNLLAEAVPGSTTRDLEVIDGRTGYDGMTYANLGTAIREQINNLHSDLSTLESNMIAADNNLNSIKANKTDVNNTIISIENEISVERARIDNIASLEEGSTTGDAELMDIRVGADGITYSSAGAAVRSQYTKNKNKIDSILEYKTTGGVKLNNPNTDESGYLNSSGNLVVYNDWHTTDFIEVEENDVMYLWTLSAREAIYYRCLYDENKELVSYSSSATYFVKIPSEIKYIRISYNEETPKYVSKNVIDIINTEIQTNSSELSENANEKLHSIKCEIGKNILNPEIVRKGSFIETGNLRFNTGWWTTDFIEVKEGATYSLSQYKISSQETASGTFYFCNTYDENHDWIEELQNGGSTCTIPNGVKYIRFCSKLNLNVDYYLQLEVAPAYTAYEPYKKMFYFEGEQDTLSWKNLKWTCVGDSLTENNIRTNIHYHDYVSQATGISVVNMGVSGTGYARGNSNFYTKIVNVPTDSDVVTIFGSGNDLSAGLPLGNPSDSGENPTTLCGYINGTIDKLFAFFPLANLGIVTPTPWQGSTPDIANNGMELYSNAIIEICKRRGIPCLDLYHNSGLHPDSATFRQLAYSKDNGGGVHPDETGHKIIAPRFKAFLETLLM